MLDHILLFILRLSSRRILGRKRLSILIYHRVLDDKDYLRSDIPTCQEFDEQMHWVSTLFNVLPLSVAVEKLQINSLPDRAMAITFDDGYKDNLTHAVPILEKYDLTATFFITTGYLKEASKWDYLTEAIRNTKIVNISFLGSDFDLSTNEAKAGFAVEVPEIIKSYPEKKADELLAKLIDDLGRVGLEDLMMKCSDLEKLSRKDMEIGAHGNHHYILSRVNNEDAWNEISGSKEKLEKIINKNINGFAYPNGLYPVDLNDTHVDMLKKAGYKYAVTTNNKVNTSKSDLYLLQRYTPWRKNKMGFVAELIANYWRANN